MPQVELKRCGCSASGLAEGLSSLGFPGVTKGVCLVSRKRGMAWHGLAWGWVGGCILHQGGLAP